MLSAKISGLARKIEGLVARNKQVGEPDDAATEGLHAASEAISLAENLQRMVDKTPDLVDVRACCCCWVPIAALLTAVWLFV